MEELPHNCSLQDNPIDATVAAIIRVKALRLVGRAGLRRQDLQDLEQNLALHLLTRREKFEPARGAWPAFARQVVGRHAENLVRARRAAKRYAGWLSPLPADLPARDGSDDARAVSDAVAALPADLRRVAEAVRDGTVASAARSLGVSRGTVLARLRRIHAHSAFADLRVGE